MTEMEISSGAPDTKVAAWNAIDWNRAKAHVYRLQVRIAKAFREGKHGKAKSLQWILTHSFYAKALAVKRVTTNRGAKTPGVDNIVWRTLRQKMEAVLRLKRHGYQTQPLRRIYISKKQRGQKRPLSIPVMKCRAQQALYLLALEPIAEMIANKNAYGFRPLRSTADALEQCFIILCKTVSAEYVLEGDIKSCFDRLSHAWILQNTQMDKTMLKKWLTAGYIEKGQCYETKQGTPQGGIISPTLLNIALSGLETAVKAATKREDKVNVVIYADDFIVTGRSKEVLVDKVKPAVENFLKERGLVLSQEKTKITHIKEGFDFLGVNIRKYRNGKLIRKPAKSSVKRFLSEIRETIKRNKTAKSESLIYLLNPKLRGWANYYRHYCSKQTFNKINQQLIQTLWWWCKRRHPRKDKGWVKRKYFRAKRNIQWQFTAKIKDKRGKIANLDVANIAYTPIRRHIKVRAEARPYDSAYNEYFRARRLSRNEKEFVTSRKSPWSAWWEVQLGTVV